MAELAGFSDRDTTKSKAPDGFIEIATSYGSRALRFDGRYPYQPIECRRAA